MIGISSLRASVTAIRSRCGSTMKTMPGRRFILRMPPKDVAQVLHLLDELGDFLLGQPLEVAARLPGLELVEQGDALLDGDEVGEHAAQPAAVDVGLAGAGGLLGDRLLGLLLGPDEEHAVAAGDGVAGGLEGEVQPLHGLGEVDDVDPVALREDERAHLGIPAAGLVAEMDAGLQQLLASKRTA